MKKVLVAIFFALLLPLGSHASGTLVKSPSYSAVYYLGDDGKRYVFPSENVYSSWYPDFSGVTTITDSQLYASPIGGNVTYKPGSKMVKITTDPKVYAVDKNGTLRWIVGEDVAVSLYGSDWATKVSDIPDAFFTNYRVGSPISQVSDFSPSARMTEVASISQDKTLGAAGAVLEVQAQPEPVVTPVAPQVEAPAVVNPVLQARFTQEPVIESTFMSSPHQGKHWWMKVVVGYVGADMAMFECLTDDPNDQAIGGAASGRPVEFALPEGGFKWGKSYDCTFTLQKKAIVGFDNIDVTQHFLFRTPDEPQYSE